VTFGSRSGSPGWRGTSFMSRWKPWSIVGSDIAIAHSTPRSRQQRHAPSTIKKVTTTTNTSGNISNLNSK